jgi:hypothetical protein
MGLWSTQAKVEGIVQKAARHRGSDSSVINNPLGEQRRTTMYVGLLSSGGPWTVTLYFPHFGVGLLFRGAASVV